ncbi:MAG: ABC transporter substrate-binding protein, partial [Candidatus Heimdallarchaeota archaeon]
AIAVQPAKTDAIDPFFTLVFKTNGGGVRPDYGNFLKQHLARIGINVDVIVQDWPTFVGELVAYRDFDICYVALTGGGADPDFTGVYNENGSLNLFGYHTDMDYNETLGTGLNEWYMRQGNLIMPPDSSERIQHYWNWEQYLMDKILPCQPVFAPKEYTAYWANLEGYDMQKCIIQSWGKMGFTGHHDGQLDNTELVTSDAAWSDLNPLFQDDTSSSQISTATMDPLIYFDADLSVHPHLAESYTFINDTTVEIVCRDGIKWQDDPDGLFPGEKFDAEDVYFTLYSWATLSNNVAKYSWIKKMEIVDDISLRLYIDGKSDTPENDPFTPALSYLAKEILPEHYLNQTQLADGVTPDISAASWNTFATHCFGTGLFELGAFTEGIETQLTVFDDCWWLDDSVDKTNMDFAARFGDFTGGLDTWRIRIIPDQQTALLEFEAGKTDIEGVTQFPETREEMTASPDFNVQNDTQFYFGFFGYNMRPVRPVIGNDANAPGDASMTVGLAIRKAISYALDRVEINNVIHRSEFTITDHPIYLKMGIWCNPNIIRYNHDLDLAREYMTIAGYEYPQHTYGLDNRLYFIDVLMFFVILILPLLILIIVIFLLVYFSFRGLNRSDEPTNFTKKIKFNCYYCQKSIKRDTVTCPKCEKKIPHCIVCSLPIAQKSIIGKCVHCEKVAHLTHLQEWMKVKGYCPNCSMKLSERDIIIEGFEIG